MTPIETLSGRRAAEQRFSIVVHDVSDPVLGPAHMLQDAQLMLQRVFQLRAVNIAAEDYLVVGLRPVQHFIKPGDRLARSPSATAPDRSA